MTTSTWARVFVVGTALGALVACEGPMGGPGAPHTVDPGLIYGQNCARCHGADGKGVEGLKTSIALKDLTDATVRAQSSEALEQVVMAGRNQMPAFGGQLSMPKIQSVVGYVRRLGASTK